MIIIDIPNNIQTMETKFFSSTVDAHRPTEKVTSIGRKKNMFQINLSFPCIIDFVYGKRWGWKYSKFRPRLSIRTNQKQTKCEPKVGTCFSLEKFNIIRTQKKKTHSNSVAKREKTIARAHINSFHLLNSDKPNETLTTDSKMLNNVLSYFQTFLACSVSRSICHRSVCLAACSSQAVFIFPKCWWIDVCPCLLLWILRYLRENS